jgi:hypothetical protein
VKTPICFLFAMLLLAVSPSRADLIVNGSFESFVIAGTDTNFSGLFIRYFSPPANTDITGWTISGSSDGSPNNVDLVDKSLYPAFAGSKSLDMEGAVGASGLIFQSFATTPGDLYNLSFEYANNPQPGPGSSGSMNVLVKGTGTLLDQNFTHSGSLFSNMNYQLFSKDFIADSLTTTLRFEALTDSGFGIALDAVSVNEVGAVPEPSLVTPLGAGLIALLFAARRRRLRR